MPVERRNPIPRGRYWLAAVDEQAVRWFDTWLRQHDTTVRVVKREPHEGTFGFGIEPGAVLWNPSTWEWGAVGHAQWVWFLFDVTEPTTRWESGIKGLGAFPNVVKSASNPNAPTITTAADTVQRPAPVTASAWLADMFSDWKTVALIAAVAYVATRKRQ